MKKRTIALLMAAVMLFGVAVGGTIAWLTAQSGQVTNTFTVGNIEITLDEADVDDSDNDNNTTERDNANEYKMIPGSKYLKDPIVHVKEGSEPCYIFVELTEINNTYNVSDKVIQYAINDGWTKVEGTDNVYVYGKSNVKSDLSIVTAPADNDDNTLNTADTSSVLKITNNTSITINSNVTADEFTKMGDDTPKLEFKAYAIQSTNLPEAATTALQIWQLAKPGTTTN